MPKIYILIGASGCGKSTAASVIEKIGTEVEGFCPIIMSKYTTRERRKNNEKEIIYVDNLPDKCDFRYSYCGKMYGFSSQDIAEALSENMTPFIIINNVWCIEKMKEIFGDIVQIVYIFRSTPELEKFNQIGMERGTPEVMKIRYEKAKAICNLYYERLKIFNSCILNVGDIISLEKQILNIISKTKRKVSTPKVYVIAGNTNSGKYDIIHMIEDYNLRGIECVSKFTTRKKRVLDKNELIFTNEQEINDKCDLIYENFGSLYGIDTKIIWENIRKGKKSVVVVTNEKAINKLCELFGEIITIIYVHSEVEAGEKQEETDEYTIKRQNSHLNAFEIYVNNINLFSHAVINTGNKEEIFEQVHRILLDKE